MREGHECLDKKEYIKTLEGMISPIDAESIVDDIINREIVYIRDPVSGGIILYPDDSSGIRFNISIPGMEIENMINRDYVIIDEGWLKLGYINLQIADKM